MKYIANILIFKNSRTLMRFKGRNAFLFTLKEHEYMVNLELSSYAWLKFNTIIKLILILIYFKNKHNVWTLELNTINNV